MQGVFRRAIVGLIRRSTGPCKRNAITLIQNVIGTGACVGHCTWRLAWATALHSRSDSEEVDGTIVECMRGFLWETAIRCNVAATSIPFGRLPSLICCHAHIRESHAPSWECGAAILMLIVWLKRLAPACSGPIVRCGVRCRSGALCVLLLAWARLGFNRSCKTRMFAYLGVLWSRGGGGMLRRS